jgi:hypothetical protein
MAQAIRIPIPDSRRAFVVDLGAKRILKQSNDLWLQVYRDFACMSPTVNDEVRTTAETSTQLAQFGTVRSPLRTTTANSSAAEP